MKHTYKVGGRSILLELDEEYVAVRYKEPAEYDTRETVAQDPSLGAFDERVEVPREKYTVLPVAVSKDPAGVRCERALKALGASADVDRAAPVFRAGDAWLLATDRLLVGLRSGADAEAVFEQNGCTLLDSHGDEHVVQIPENADPFEFAMKLDAQDDVEYAEPDFVTIGKHVARRDPEAEAEPSDPLASSQYAIEITKAVQAWDVTLGDPSIRIAILDEGVDTAHEDLAASIVGTFDGVDNDSDQEPNSWDGHGTACAGLAAAIHGNDVGIKGVGGGCSILAGRIAYSPSDGANWVTRNTWIARAIDWAWENGADVISNSWGGGTPSSAIINACNRARTQGRGGKGSVIIAAAGNSSGPVIFPATEPDILTVSASNEYDEFKTKTSQDGEYWWGSCFGPEVDVAAPGVHNQTTDISGSGGYTSGNYTDFNGTSSATPIVAGVAGLVLSANPDLTEAEVRHILRDSADEVGDEPYVGGRNDQFGYGRVNALEAVNLALAGVSTNGSGGTVLHKITKSVPLKDHQTSEIGVVVGEEQVIADIRIRVKLEHTWIGDLEVMLVPPAAPGVQPISLHHRTGSGTDDIKKTYDTSTTPALAGLIGKMLPGEWKLTVEDTQTADEGRILSFGVEIDY